jgi:hypothetical protein
LTSTLADPVLTPPLPARPPAPPASRDLRVALVFLADGLTSADAEARAAGPFDPAAAARSAGLVPPGSRDAGLFAPGSEVARRMLALRASLPGRIARLEGLGWTPETARAALGLPEPRKPVAA